MPTPKQVRFHYGKVMKLYRKLESALNDAHNADVIEYPSDKFADEAPCYLVYKLQDRIRKTTEKALAQAMRSEITSKF